MFIIFYTLILIYLLISISLEDLKTMYISENKLILFAGIGITYLIYLGLSNEQVNFEKLIKENILFMIIIYIVLYLFSHIIYKIIGIRALGIGDIKLFSIASIWLGIELSFLSFCISFLLSAIFSLHGKIIKTFKPFQQYPFAPFISIGIFCSWIIDKI